MENYKDIGFSSEWDGSHEGLLSGVGTRLDFSFEKITPTAGWGMHHRGRSEAGTLVRRSLQ